MQDSLTAAVLCCLPDSTQLVGIMIGKGDAVTHGPILMRAHFGNDACFACLRAYG